MWASVARWGLLVLCAFEVIHAQVGLTGRVLDENGTAVSGAKIQFATEAGDRAASAVSDAGGNFRLALPSGNYLVRAEHAGFFTLERYPVLIEPALAQITLTLNHLRELIESVDVYASPPGIDPAQIVEQKQLNNVEILQVPYPAPNDLRSSLPLFQGVIQDHKNRIHFEGGSADQVNYLLDGFNVSDPVTGTLEARLSIDAVRALELETGRFSAQKGRGSTASLDIRSGMGDDRFSLSGTNFFPGVSAERGLYVNKWTPRITFSGPLARGRAWFFNGFDCFYDVDTIKELPKGQDRARGVTANDLTRFQINVKPAQILTASFLANYMDSNRAGLSYLNPVETTTSRRRTYFMSTLRHQAYFQGGTIAEFGFADSRGLVRDIPKGTETFEITPTGRRGNYFVDLRRHFERQEWYSQLMLPARDLRGDHQFTLGINVQRAAFDQKVRRHDYQVLRADGSIARHVSFLGSGLLRKSNVEAALYVQDRWKVRERVLVEFGFRADRDHIVRRVAASPRINVSYAPARFDDFKISAGYGLFHDPLTLGTLAQGEDQASLSTFFGRDGTLAMGPIQTEFRVDPRSLEIPSSRLLSITLEKTLPGNFLGRLGYIRRTGRNGLAFVNDGVVTAVPTIAYTLQNRRNDRYDSVEFALRRTFARKFEWFGSYTWSAARSDAVVDYSLENPIFALQSGGPLEWDTPHRFLTWGWAPFPSSWLPGPFKRLFSDTSIAYLAESRTGFPFSVVTEEGILAGEPNTWRFPNYFNVNLHLEKRFRFRQTLWAWRFGYNNITDSENPNVVNNVLGSPDFLTYGRGQSRAFTVRLRFLGRKS